MRTNIVIDETLMSSALKVSGIKTKKEAVEEGLKLLLMLKKQSNLKLLRGKIKWEGDIDRMRAEK